MRIGKRISVGLLGLAFGLTCAGTADAQPHINSSTITSPDAGAKVGIDSTVTVKVSVFHIERRCRSAGAGMARQRRCGRDGFRCFVRRHPNSRGSIVR